MYQDLDPDIIVVREINGNQRKLIRAEVPAFIAEEKAKMAWWRKILERCYEVGYLNNEAPDFTDKLVFLYTYLAS